MRTVAVVAHRGKGPEAGLRELREVLAREGQADPLWHEVTKSRKAPKFARRALAQGAEVLFVWGGDGTVQRCIDAVAGTQAVLAILPAGTANLLAANLLIPAGLTEAVQVGLHGDRRRLDTGSVNGEHLAVMAGAGFDARMIRQADGGMKKRIGRAAYAYAGARNLSPHQVKAVIDVDGRRFFTGQISCVLVGNVGKVLGGLEVFPGARPDDGRPELGVGTAGNRAHWARTLGAARAEQPGEVAVHRSDRRHYRPDPVRARHALRARRRRASCCQQAADQGRAFLDNHLRSRGQISQHSAPCWLTQRWTPG